MDGKARRNNAGSSSNIGESKNINIFFMEKELLKIKKIEFEVYD